MKRVVALLAGVVFGLGLLISGMTSPDKVVAFLDIAGDWDPSLAFVMGGAVVTAMPLFWVARQRAKPVIGDRHDDPPTQRIDAPLVIGSVVFGLGWGLAGICPGPALVDLILAPLQMAPFVLAMALGILVVARLRRAG